MIRRPPRSPLFPYPPLFRSRRLRGGQLALEQPVEDRRELRRQEPVLVAGDDLESRSRRRSTGAEALELLFDRPRHPVDRSEEHTSELQSQSNLVCRLLLEKK